MEEKSSGIKSLPIVIAIIGAIVIIGIILAFVLPKTNAPAPAPTVTQIEATEMATNTAQPSPTPLPPTATSVPTAAATLIPSPTPIPPLAMQENGFSAWCYPDEQITAPPSGAGIAIPPEGEINKSTIVDGVPEVPIPGYSCNYVFDFNQKAPDGLTVEIYDWLQKKPIFTLPLTPATDKPTAAVLYTTNSYLSKRVFWEYTYKFIVKDKEGKELWNNPVHLNVPWRPAICLAGVYPKATSLRCPLRQDAHPWDPWYKKTPVPNDDDNPIP
jgi:hypothetical protein